MAEETKYSNKFIGAVVIVFLVVAYFVPKSEGKKIAESNERKPRSHYKNEARIYSEKYVLEKLKAPSTAEFGESDAGVNQIDNNTFTVFNYVDAQNSFGAKLRQTYSCKITFVSDDDVRCENLIINDY
jgi:hypothetical protein